MRFIRIAVLSMLTIAFLQPGKTFAGTAVLRWHATGDDSIFGRATAYDLRYSTSPITITNFGSAMGVPNLPIPSPAGYTENITVSGLSSGTTYYFALKARDEAGNWSALSNVATKTAINLLDVGDEMVRVAFSPPRPNPARAGTLFVIDLPEPAKVVVEAFDISGRLVRTIADQSFEAGQHSLRWDLYDERGSRLSPGVYKVRGRLGKNTFVRTVAVIQ
jgi:hypothetical protein